MEVPQDSPQSDVTKLLNEIGGDNGEALDRLIPLVYDELSRMAHHKLSFERAGHTLNTTALVHEAYLRLVRQRDVEWANRAHFFAIAAQAMRRILVNYAVKRKADKRGGGAVHVPVDESIDRVLSGFSDARIDEVISINDAMLRLEAFDERGCRVVEYRFFGGLTYDEIAEVMNLSNSTVRRAWTAAKTWLYRELRESRP